MAARTFECAECEQTYTVRSLSAYSRRVAGTEDPEQALDTLEDDDVICKACDVTGDEIPGAARWPEVSEQELWEFSGLAVDQGKLDAYHLSY